jgi:hypothetical protein
MFTEPFSKIDAMNWFTWILLILVALLAIAAPIADTHLDEFVKRVVEEGGASLTGVPVTLDSADCQFLRDMIYLRSLTVGNPKGFNAEKALGAGRIDVDISMRSLFRDTVFIRHIVATDPEIVYERGLGKSNFSHMLDGMTARSAGKQTTNADGKRVVIEDLLIKAPKLRLSSRFARSSTVPVQMRDIHLTNIGQGGENPGASVREVLGYVLDAVAGSVGKVVTDSVGLVGDGAKAVGGEVLRAPKTVGNAVEEGAGTFLGGVKGLLGGEETGTRAPAAPAKP